MKGYKPSNVKSAIAAAATYSSAPTQHYGLNAS